MFGKLIEFFPHRRQYGNLDPVPRNFRIAGDTPMNASLGSISASKLRIKLRSTESRGMRLLAEMSPAHHRSSLELRLAQIASTRKNLNVLWHALRD